MESSLRAFVERVIASGLLQPDLIELADRGATTAELALAPTLPAELQELLAWRNGLNLDVVRLHGIGAVTRRIELAEVDGEIAAIVFASDPAGFLYLLRPDGTVALLDHDGGKIEIVAANVDDFLRGYIFGSRAGEFGGDAWSTEVAAAVGES